MGKEESRDYLSKQIITYIGNKRELLKEIDLEVAFVCEELSKEKLVCLDLFSGSGIVARFLKQHSSKIIANYLEAYSKVINECFLSNKSEFNSKLFNEYLLEINRRIVEKPIKGIIRKNYSPKNDKKITAEDRAFYTNENATYIDSFRYYIDEVVPENYKKYFLALLLTEASIHVNTCGVFKGFYKDCDTGIGKFGGKAENALARIKGEIKIDDPVLSNFETEYEVYQEDANRLAGKLKGIDLVYLDPPYNQHPYGSNYFMLNIKFKIDYDTFENGLGDRNVKQGIKKTILFIDVIMKNSSSIVNVDSINLEHIYPQKPDPQWATENWPTNSDEQKDIINNIGNYLLLNEEVNKRIKNKYIDAKVVEYNRIIPQDLSLGTEMNTVDFERFKNERKSYVIERQKAIAKNVYDNFKLAQVIIQKND